MPGKQLVPAQTDADDYEDYHKDTKYIQEHKLEWLGERESAAGYADKLYKRAGFTLLADPTDPSSKR